MNLAKHNRNDLALERFLFELCGQDINIVRNTEIREIGLNKYHLQYQANNPYEGLDLKLHIEVIRELGAIVAYHYTIWDSVYGDDGDVTID